MTALVVKIGGSLLGTLALPDCLDRVVRSKRKIVIVPGGGPFADKVRSDQKRLGMSDADAHRLAIFAMHDMASEFISLQPGLELAAQRDEIENIWSLGQVPVWLPWSMVEHAKDVPQDWSVTSDGLAAWLAKQLDADVALIKSCPIPQDISPEHLAAAGIADPTFAKIVRDHRVTWHAVAADDAAKLTALIG